MECRARGTYNKDSQIKFKSEMLKASLCDYSDAYLLAEGAISIAPQARENPSNGG